MEDYSTQTLSWENISVPFRNEEALPTMPEQICSQIRTPGTY